MFGIYNNQAKTQIIYCLSLTYKHGKQMVLLNWILHKNHFLYFYIFIFQELIASLVIPFLHWNFA